MAWLGDVIRAVGITAFFGISGAYLIVAAIVGQFVPKQIRIKSIGQRAALGFFGFLLFLPTLFSIYAGIFTPYSPRGLPPEIPERIYRLPASPQDTLQQNNALTGKQLALIHTPRAVPSGLQPAKQPECRPVESFGLTENHIRRLKYPGFQDRVFVYIDDIRFMRKSELKLVIADKSALPASGAMQTGDFQERVQRLNAVSVQKLRVTTPGDSLDFTVNNTLYRLRIKKIYLVFFGSDKLAIEICRLPSSN